MTKILVIEDERGLREDIVDALTISAFEVIAAPNGQTGLELARQHQPDLILCDIRMPEMNGFTVLEELRQDATTAPIPFIFISAQGDRDSMRSGMRLGADDFITKPFSVDELLTAVEARLERRNAFVRDAESKLEQAKLRLTRMVTHELKTPLISMNSVLDIVNRRMGALKPEELQEMLASMEVGGRRLNHLVEQMVLVTQLESGFIQRATLPQKGVPLSLTMILNGAVTLSNRFANNRSDVELRVEPFDAEVNILCHAQPLKHAFAEVIANALNFSPPNAVVMLRGWQAGRAIWTTITDQGPGMTPEQIAQVGQSFSQVDRESREQQGMGMGLMLAHQITILHGGILQLHSEPGSGLQVQIGLPIMGR
ncbi:MAG: response regulator [Chloroflexota bacterium]|nr:response regulator [Chloroflexota bacterium]